MDNSLKRIWGDEYLVNWYEADMTGKAKLSSICNYLQESAWRHATHLGFGFEDAKARNEVWVIVGLMLKMLRYPDWGETITVQTWPKGIDRILAFRDFSIIDKSKEVIGAATSTWMILDINTRRPRPVEIVRDVLHLAVRQDILNENPPHLVAFSSDEIISSRYVQFSEVDFNGHVNNTRYIDWCIDALPVEWHHSHRINTLIINYLSEVRINENVSIYKSSRQEDSVSLQGIRKDNQKAIFRAKFLI